MKIIIELRGLLMNSNFQLLDKTEKLVNEISKLMDNYPKKNYVLSNNIEKTMYEMIESIFYFQCNKKDRIRMKYIKEYIVKLSMFDFYINLSYRKRIISEKCFLSTGKKITELRKIAYGIVRSENNEEE